MKKQLLLFFTLIFTFYSFAQVVANQPTPMEVCDDAIPDETTSFDLTLKNAEVLGNQNPNDFSVMYYLTQMDADVNTNPLASPYTNTVNPQTVYVRVEELNSGNYSTVTLDLYVNLTPTANTPTDMEVCDDAIPDETTSFDLTLKNAEVLGNQNPNDFSVTYYETPADAQADANAIPDPTATAYSNNANPQTIYAVVSSLDGNCVSNIVSFNLIVNSLNINTQSYDLIACNDQGIGFFDLTIYENQITGGNQDLLVSYYQDLNDANNNTNPITNPTFYENYSSPYYQTIYIRIDNINSGCYYVSNNTALYLNVETLQIIQPTPLVEEDPDNDGFTTFNLTDKDLEITGGATGLIVTYHETEADAVTGNNPIVNTSNYTNVSNPQNIYVRVESVNSNCSALVELVLLTEYAPFQVNSAILDVCGTNATGTAVFDLTAANPDILSSLNVNDYTIAYYEIYDNALSQTNTIANPSSYTANPNVTVVYAGVTATATGDYVITTINLQINELPIIIFEDVYSLCSGNTIMLAPYTVTQQDCIYQWNTGEDTPTIMVTQSGDYTVTITNTVTGCVNTDTTTVNIGFYPVLGTASNLTSCDPNQAYDLTITIPEILDGLDFNQYTVTFYESTADATNQVNAIQNPSSYLPVNTNQTITASVNEVNSECSSLSFFDIITSNCPVTVTCGQPVTASFCYSNNETQQYNFSSNDGSSLYIVFNSGSTEINFDELIVLDSDGTTNLNADNPYGLNNSGDLSGLTFTTTGTTATVYIQSDGSVISCENDPIDFDVFCASNIGFIDVNAFLDNNNDGVFNGTDLPFTNGFFTYEINNDGNISTVNSNTGSFNIINQDEANSYDITFATNTGYENCFNIPTALFQDITVLNGNTVTVDFPITEQMACEDLSVYLIPFSSPRPGFNYWNDLVIENLGSTTIASGTVTFIHDTIVDYVDANPLDSGLTVTQTATGATVDFTNLLPGELRVVWFRLYTPVTVNLGEYVTSSVVYTTAANDVVSENNVSIVTQEVIGSYDPNDIKESHGPDIIYNDFVTTDEYLYYTIRFQNVGTAEAINVRIENTVDSQLDLSTLQFLRATHDVVMMRNGNQLTWTFDNINLPAQSQDDFASNGYVYYKIKPNAGYAVGTIIPNTAEIYFDFNAPVITNTFETEFVENNLSVDEFNVNGFALFPNPATSTINIKLNNISSGTASIEIIDVQGKIVINDVISETLQLNVKSLQAGLYFVKLNLNNKQTIKKLIIE